MGGSEAPVFGFAREAGEEGWFRREPTGDGGFVDSYGTIRVRQEDAKTSRVRFATGQHTANLVGGVHGGFLLAVVDQAIFVGPTVCGFRALGGSTVDLSSQFLAPVGIGLDVDAVVEVLRETGRMLFLRGLVEQNGDAKLAFSATLRKPS